MTTRGKQQQQRRQKSHSRISVGNNGTRISRTKSANAVMDTSNHYRTIPTTITSGADGRLWRPASGFEHIKRQQRQQNGQDNIMMTRNMKQIMKVVDEVVDEIEIITLQDEETEWKTVMRKHRIERRSDSATSSSSCSDSSTTSSPPLHEEGLSKKWMSRRDVIFAGGPNDKHATLMTMTPLECKIPPPSFLGTPMFRRESSLQKLVDKMSVDEMENGVQLSTPAVTPSSRARTPSSSLSHRRRLNSPPYRGERRQHNTEQSSERQALRKCGDKRDFFFRNLDFETRNQLQVDEVAAFSVTDYEMATKISEVVLALFASRQEYQSLMSPSTESQEISQPKENSPRKKFPLTITDGTACVGGNVLSFCDYFTHVNAVECDQTRVEMLKHNLSVLKKTNVTCVHASYLDVMYTLTQDIVFMDPPWGGPEYKDLAKVDLFLDEIPLYEICARLHGRAKYVVLKVPSNFDDEKFSANIPGVVTIHRDLKKMALVIVDFSADEV